LGALAVLMAALVAGALVASDLLRQHDDRGAVTGTDLHGNTVQLDPDSGLTPKLVQEMDAVVDTGERFTVPSVGLDVPLGSLDMVHDTITPPGFSSAYFVRNLGVAPGSATSTAGTVFVALHSLRGGGVGPGNYLIDVDTGRSRVADGATITVAGIDYTVTGSRVIGKQELPGAADVWANTPGKLVVITCLQRPDGRASTQNMVITAQLAH